TPEGIEVSAEEQVSEEKEILSERGLNSKTFFKEKGKFETIYYNAPIHYYDEEMKAYTDIGNDVGEEGDKGYFRTRKHTFEAIFHRQKDSNALFTLSRGDCRATVSLKGRFGEQLKRPVPVLDQKNNRISYTDAVSGSDYDCIVTSDGVKTVISAKNPRQKGRYAFSVFCDNIRYQWNESEKVLQFLSENTDDVVFEITAPFMIDANGMYSENVAFEIFSENEHECELTVIPDLGWLSSGKCAYPVRMEWTMIADEQQVKGIEFERCNISADGKVSVGGSGVPFRMHLPEHRAGVITKKVRALFRCDSVPVAEDKDYILALSRVTVSDTENKPVSEVIGVSTMSIGKEEYAFDVTSEYAADESTTYSLQICEEQDGELVATADSAVALMTVSADSAVATYSVTETDGTSKDDSSSGVSGNIGSVGTYGVDLVSGKLNMEMRDFAWEGNRMPISISRSYKGQYASQNYGFWSDTNGSFGNMLIGYGWRLNLMQSMVNTGEKMINNKKTHTYTYTDESGAETVFAQCKCESGSATCTTYEDVDDLGYTYDAGSGILKKGTEKHTFVSGRLVKIVDEFGNSMTINYSSGRITSVRDGVGRLFTFGYNGNYLESVTAPNGASVQYQYCNGNLCCVSYPNGQILTFTYDTVDNQPDTVTVSGDGISPLTTCFTFNTAKKVSKVSTKTGNVYSGKYTEFAYDSNGKQAIVTEVDTGETDIETIRQYKVYLHEHPEKNYTYYEAGNENKIAVSGSSGMILPYTEPGMEIGNLRCQNLLRNHNFNTGITEPTNVGWSTNLTGDYRDVQYDPPEKMPGFCAAYLVSLYSTDRQRGIWQTVNLTANKSYVFSCYLKLDQGNSNPERGVYLMVRSANGTTTYRSQMITSKKEFQRVALPFTVDASCGLSYTVGIYIDGNAKAKAIAPQLEEGTMLSPYNYLAVNQTSVSIAGSANCECYRSVAHIKVPAAKDAKETFTLSGYAKGNMTYSSDESRETCAALKAVIYYMQTTEERRNNILPQSKPFEVPIYTNSSSQTFAMVQFCKDQFRSVDYIDIICDNNYNPNTVTFSGLQLVRNSYVDGLTEEDFSADNAEDATANEEETDESLLTSSVRSEDDETETIKFEEILDAYGNALTGTNFKNGELGAIYTEYRYENIIANDGETDYNDEGNNKTQEIDARGKVSSYGYDAETSKPTKVTDRCGNETLYTYDSAGRTTGVTAANGGTVNYSYNSYDDLTGITRGDGQSYTMGYDAYRNLTSVNVGSENLVNYNYKSGTNRLKSMTYANGSVQTLIYDRFGNAIGEKWVNGTTTEAEYRYFYDASNQLVKTLDVVNKKMYNINRIGENITSVEEYDAASINTSTYVVSGLTLVGTMHYSFDSDGKQFRKKYID
ncbi:MAG: DUF6531 domain-containing protein, partial [Eubacteriales bacterium]